MSTIEKDELSQRIKGMSAEEQQLAVKLLPDEVLWGELQRRYAYQRRIIKAVKAAVNEN